MLVLLVDDDRSILDLMDHVVGQEGFRTERAEDGAEALRKAKALNPDILVLDVMLPSMGGHEILRELQTAGFSRIPVIIITGQRTDAESMKQICAEANVKEFLAKPMRPAILIAAIHRILGTRLT
jgi:DNA-binding response OmpR family regulator